MPEITEQIVLHQNYILLVLVLQIQQLPLRLKIVQVPSTELSMMMELGFLVVVILDYRQLEDNLILIQRPEIFQELVIGKCFLDHFKQGQLVLSWVLTSKC